MERATLARGSTCAVDLQRLTALFLRWCCPSLTRVPHLDIMVTHILRIRQSCPVGMKTLRLSADGPPQANNQTVQGNQQKIQLVYPDRTVTTNGTVVTAITD